MPDCGTTDAIFILGQLQEKCLSKKKDIYIMFVDLAKAFDRVSGKVLWCVMRTLGNKEWVMLSVASFYVFVNSKKHVNETFSEEFGVRVAVHQGSVWSPLLFIVVLEALSRTFRTGCPWE